MNHIEDLRKTAQAIKEEAAQRAEIMASTQYQDLQSSIEQLQSIQQEMLATVPDSTEEYEADKQAVIEQMLKDGTQELEGFTVKIRKKNKVNTYRVLQELEGDIDNLMLIASVSQSALTKFIKENKQYKDLKYCIEPDGFTITDITINS